MQNIRNIIFDLGGVILDIDFGRAEKAFLELGLQNFQELFGLGHADSFIKDHEFGKISDEQFLASLQKLAKHSSEKDAFLKAWNALLIRFPEERIELLKRLKERYRLFLLSNTNAIHVVAFLQMYREAFDNGSFEDLFEKVYYSHKVGLRKPNKEIYEYVITDSNLRADETLFIDDALVNVEAAREAGLQAIHLKQGMTLLDLNFEI
jgi:putative hydrolase of the HAD superfamily